jgi:hypothetical protein
MHARSERDISLTTRWSALRFRLRQLSNQLYSISSIKIPIVSAHSWQKWDDRTTNSYKETIIDI